MGADIRLGYSLRLKTCSLPKMRPVDDRAMANTELHVIRDGMHTHLVAPALTLYTLLPQLEGYFAHCHWISAGWGDLGYYGATHQPWWLGLRALLLPTSAVVGLRPINNLVDCVSESATLYTLQLSPTLMKSVAMFVCRHLALDRSDQLTMVRERSCGTQFFAAQGVYTLANTCNNWTSYGLQTAGLAVHPMINFFPGQVEATLRHNGYLPVKRGQ
jgi:hypothetical protein